MKGEFRDRVPTAALPPSVGVSLSLSAGSTTGEDVIWLFSQKSRHTDDLQTFHMRKGYLVSEYVVVFFQSDFLFCNGCNYAQESNFQNDS